MSENALPGFRLPHRTTKDRNPEIGTRVGWLKASNGSHPGALSGWISPLRGSENFLNSGL